MNALAGIGFDFVRLVFDIALFLLLIRLLLQLMRADFYNPMSQAVVRATAFLDPLRRTLGAWNGLDIATFVTLIVLKMIQVTVLLRMLPGSHSPDVGLLLAVSGVSLIDLLAAFFFWAILAVVVLSWLAPDGRNPATQLLWSLTEPVLGPARRLLPPLGGIDFSPMLVMFLIYVVRAYMVPALAGAAGIPVFLL
ncbi:MAG: YggT family protein [Pseudomonadota bacterium]